MKFVITGVLFVLSLAFLVALWKAAKVWRWYNLIAAVVTMGLAIAFIFPTAGALKCRNEWHKIKETLEVRAEQATAETKTLKYGNPNDASAGQGVVQLAQELAKLGIEAGRRWRGLRMANNNVQSIQLNRPAQAPAPGVPAGDEAAAPPPPAGPLIPNGLVVYGFSESKVQGVEGTLPTFFLGEFIVAASTPNAVTLRPTGPLEPDQRQRITEGQAAVWSIYELLPLDAHDPFVAEGSSPSDDNLFGRVDDKLVQDLLGNNVREQTIQKYRRDGSRSTPDDPPLSRWVRVEFTKTYSIDVDSPDKRGALEGGFFDDSGRAVDSRLQRGEDGMVKFKSGDRVVVKEEFAKQLTDVEDVARLVDTYYLRPLNDYRFVLRRIRLRLTQLSIRTKELNYEQEVLNAALAATVSMLTSNQKEKLKLEQDLTQTQVEAKAISEYHQRIQEEVNKARQTLVSLYQSNQQLEQQLRKAHSSIINSAQ